MTLEPQKALDPRPPPEQVCVDMVPAKASDAQAAYGVRRALVELRLEELRTALEAHEATRPLLQSHVRDLDQVDEKLVEIVRLLTLPGE